LREPPWPNLIVIGAMRAGTTSLHALLGRHPDVFASAIKGPGLFLDPEHALRYPSKYRSHAEKRGFRGDAALRAAMARGYGGERWLAESTDLYARHPVAGLDIPQRMLRARPDARLVYLLRDPVERILSQHRFERHKPHRPAPASLASYLRSDADPIGASRYHTQLRRFLEAGFERGQVHVTTLEELARDPAAELGRLAGFLGLPPWPASALAPLPHLNAAPRAGDAASTRAGRERLERLLAPEVRALEAWLGRALPFGAARARRVEPTRSQTSDAYTASVRAASRPQA
jgi:hypothetical protein